MRKFFKKAYAVAVALAVGIAGMHCPMVSYAQDVQGGIVEVEPEGDTSEEPQVIDEADEVMLDLPAQPTDTEEAVEEEEEIAGVEREIDITPAGQTGTVLPNVSVNGVSVAGMTSEQAVEALAPVIDSFSGVTVKFILDDKEETISMAEVGYTTNEAEVVNKALACGKKGNCLKRFKDKAELDAGIKSEDFSIVPKISDEGRDSVEALLMGFNCEPVPASITMKEDSTFDITPEQEGISVNVDATLEELTKSAQGEWSNEIPVNVVCERIVPDATSDVLSEMTDQLASFTTSYGGGDAGRMANVENACSFLNGTLLMPGETLDVNSVFEPYTEENGYYYAGEYNNGKVVQGIGGGICQVSTTLYNAVLYAELEIVERYNHSLTVGYVELSRDAAIAGTVKNFVFRNNMDTPIYIAGGCSNGQITFAIYGKETRPANRTLEFESRLIGTVAPGAPIEEVDPSLAPGERRVTQKAHTGYVAELWKHVYVDGVLQESVQINSSNYNATPEYASIGPGDADDSGDDEASADDTPSDDAPAPEPAPEPTPEPAPEPAPEPPAEE